MIVQKTFCNVTSKIDKMIIFI